MRILAESNARVEASSPKDNSEIYLPNIAELDLDMANQVMGYVGVMIERREDAGMNVHAKFGERESTSLQTYMSWLRERVVNLSGQSSGSSASDTLSAPASSSGTSRAVEPMASSDPALEANRLAASAYGQVQRLVDFERTQGDVRNRLDGAAASAPLEARLSWLAKRAGVSVSV